MEIDRLTQLLDDPDNAGSWLAELRLVDPRRGRDNLRRLATEGVPLDLLVALCDQLQEHLPELSDPDMALNNLERFVCAARSPLAMAALFERDPDALPPLLELFSTSQYLSDLLVRDPGAYDLLRMTEGAPVAREELIADIVSEVRAQPSQEAVMRALRRFKQRETLRIAYGDIVRNQHLEIVTRQISFLAEAIVEAALQMAMRTLSEKRGTPRRPDGQRARFVVLAMGKLGGEELNYSSDIDLVFLYDVDGQTDGARSQSNREFFAGVCRELFGLLTETTDLGTAYRVDLRLRPEGSRGPIVGSLESFLRYYDVMGRTWERQAYIKARPIAGDLDLGRELLEELTPWIYRRYLSLADITGIKSLKRRIEEKSPAAAGAGPDVKTGHGGIRDIEFVIQFLQLLNGGTLPEIRTGNTLEAVARLEQNGCLTFQERSLLEQNYRFLRKIEHRLQIMFDLQTHQMPSDEEELRKLAIRMGVGGTPHQTAVEAFRADFRSKTELNRKILDHLLHDAFGDDAKTDPEVDLVNDPDARPERIHSVLGEYGFRDVNAAYHNLMELATEKIRFLSTRRCRHFLAAIAPKLLPAIAATPDPDATLVNLNRVSDSLGGKGVLWELFSFHPPSMELYVRLCAACQYLSSILTSNPGMIDELLDSLRLVELPEMEMLEQSLADLCRGAEDIEPILHSFKDAQHLRVGIRDILGRDDISGTHAALSDVAEVCLRRIAEDELPKLEAKFGRPMIEEGPRAGQPAELIILALGKLGGREPNYHSDLDVVFLYDEQGRTVHRRRNGRSEKTSNQHFFSELGQRIIKTATRLGPYGRLYEVDPRLRPTGRSGALAVPIEEFRRYFATGSGQLWERQALCKARVIAGSSQNAERTMQAVHEAAFGQDWREEYAEEIRQMRYRLESTASPRNLKRGPGGTVDVEFAVQMLQLRHGGAQPSVRAACTLNAIDALHTAGILSNDDHGHFSYAYRFLRSVESRIRLMNATARHDMPEDERELKKLGYLLGYGDVAALTAEAARVRSENRRRFEAVFGEA